MDALTPARRPDVYSSGGSALAREFALDAARGVRTDAYHAMVLGLQALHAFKDATLSKDFRIDFAKGLRDELSSVAGRIEKDLDNAGLAIDLVTLDLAELDDEIAKLEAV